MEWSGVGGAVHLESNWCCAPLPWAFPSGLLCPYNLLLPVGSLGGTDHVCSTFPGSWLNSHQCSSPTTSLLLLPSSGQHIPKDVLSSPDGREAISELSFCGSVFVLEYSGIPHNIPQAQLQMAALGTSPVSPMHTSTSECFSAMELDN